MPEKIRIVNRSFPISQTVGLLENSYRKRALDLLKNNFSSKSLLKIELTIQFAMDSIKHTVLSRLEHPSRLVCPTE